MIKKYLWIAVLIFGFISCEEAPNDYSPEANVFLNAIDGKVYAGKGAYADASFEAHGTVIAEHGAPPNDPLIFQNTIDNGTSTTRAIYRLRITDPVEDGEFVGIEIEDSGDTLRRTAPENLVDDINWNSAFVFAIR